MARLPSVSDDDILATLATLRAHGRPPSVRVLREVLKERFGGRCGTNRVYSLIRTRAVPAPAPSEWESPSPFPLETAVPAPGGFEDRLTQLRVERDAALKRAELAEFRERATQDRTAYQIYELREKLRRLGVDPFA